MTIQVNNQQVSSIVTAGENRVFKNKNRSFQVRFSERRILLVLVDTLLVVLAMFGALVLWQRIAHVDLDISTLVRVHWFWLPLLLSSWWVLGWLNDFYHIPSSFDITTSVMRVATVSLINLAIYGAVFFWLPTDLPHGFFLYFLVIVWAAITVWRWVYASLFSRLQQRVLVVGHGERGQSVVKVLKEAAKLNYQVLGYVDDNNNNVSSSLAEDDGLPVLGQVADLPYLVQQLQIHEVVVAIEDRLKNKLFERLVECQVNGVRVSLMSDIYQNLYGKIPVEHIDPDSALNTMQNRLAFSRFDLGLKRLVDLMLAVVGLVILFPFLPLVILAIRLDSPGPIFYRQTRSGRGGNPFSIIKFRTMVSDAEKDGKARWAAKDDYRITRVGRILRKSRVDELPQLINVLRGEMSIIGPRPERPEFIEELQQTIPFYRTRLLVKPGLTGWAQIQYSYGNTVEDALIKLQYDFYYLRFWSLWLDLYIIFQTFSVVFKFKGM